MTENKLEVHGHDVHDFIKGYFTSQMGNPGNDPEYDKRIDSIVDSVMQNQEEVNRLYDQLQNDRVKNLFKAQLKLKNKKVSYDEFIKLATNH